MSNFISNHLSCTATTVTLSPLFSFQSFVDAVLASLRTFTVLLAVSTVPAAMGFSRVRYFAKT